MGSVLKPLTGFVSLDGYHCHSNSLAKIYHYYGCALSEEMLLGLGAGMGYFYWHQKGTYPFMGGRTNIKNFFQDIGRRTGVIMEQKTTTSIKKAEQILIRMLQEKKPVMLFGDMGFLPWFDLPEDYHFGSHTFVVCGYDGSNNFLASDMEQKAISPKQGYFHKIDKQTLSQARASTFKPFPPKNAYFEFDFSGFHQPTKEDSYTAIRQAAEQMLNPPISNGGVKGIRRTAKEILRWPKIFSDHELRMCLFTIYIFIEIGGTGGGCFRPMYARFLNQVAEMIKNPALKQIAEMVLQSGNLFTDFGLGFKQAEHVKNLNKLIQQVPEKLNRIADLEQEIFTRLSEVVN